MPDAVKGLVFDGGLPALLSLVLFELHQFVHDELPVARGNLRVACGQIRAGDLQVHSRLFNRFVFGMEKPQGCCAVVGAKAFLFAGHVIVNVVATAVFSFIESCIVVS